MAKINFDAPLKDAHGNTIFNHVEKEVVTIKVGEKVSRVKKEKEKPSPRKLADFIVEAMLLDNSSGLAKEKKLERAKIAFKVGAGGKQEYSHEELTEIKEVVGKAYGPLVYGRLCELIDKN